jgi:hypothetical protein
VLLKSTKNLANYNTDTKDNQQSKFFILKKKGRNRKKMQNQSNEVNASSCIIYSSDFTPLYPIKIWFFYSRTVLIRLPSLSLLSKVSNQLISTYVLALWRILYIWTMPLSIQAFKERAETSRRLSKEIPLAITGN